MSGRLPVYSLGSKDWIVIQNWFVVVVLLLQQFHGKWSDLDVLICEEEFGIDEWRCAAVFKPLGFGVLMLHAFAGTLSTAKLSLMRDKRKKFCEMREGMWMLGKSKARAFGAISLSAAHWKVGFQRWAQFDGSWTGIPQWSGKIKFDSVAAQLGAARGMQSVKALQEHEVLYMCLVHPVYLQYKHDSSCTAADVKI